MPTIEADDFRTVIEPGTYTAKTNATVYLSQGKGDSRRDVSFREYKAGETIEVPATVSGHWYGLEPNGDMFAPKTAIIEAIRKGTVLAKANKTDCEFQRFAVAEINGDIYYWNTSVNDWCSIPPEWISKIAWS